MPGIVMSYLHGDRTAAHKGGSLVTVVCETDFAAKTDLFTAFARKTARMAYAAIEHADDGIVPWSAIVGLFPELEVERKALEAELREIVKVLPAAVQRLPA